MVRMIRTYLLQESQRYCIEITKRLGLDAVSDHRKQQLPGQVRRRFPSGHALPAGSQDLEVETAQMRDLILQRDDRWACTFDRGRRMGLGSSLCTGGRRSPLTIDAIDATTFGGFREQIEPKLLSNNSG